MECSPPVLVVVGRSCPNKTTTTFEAVSLGNNMDYMWAAQVSTVHRHAPPPPPAAAFGTPNSVVVADPNLVTQAPEINFPLSFCLLASALTCVATPPPDPQRDYA